MLQTGRKNLKQHNFAPKQTKTCFSCNNAESRLFKHTRKKTLFLCDKKLKPAQTANTPKHVFDKLERWAEHWVALSLMSHKKHVLVCFPQSCVVSSVIAPGKGFLPVSSKSPCFSLDFTQNNVFACVWLSYNGFASFWLGCAVFNIIFLRTTFSSLFLLPNCPCKLRCFQFDRTKNMFLFVGN